MKIYSKGGILLAEVTDAPYTGAFMGERFISCNVKSEKPIEFLPEDYADFRGERFVLDYTPTAKKISSAGSVRDAFQCDLKLISIADKELRACLFRNLFLNDNRIHPGSPIVDVFADARLLANMIQASLNEDYKGEKQWTITVLKDSEARQINVQDIKCWDAVALFKSEYNFNFIIKNRNVTVGTVGNLIDHVFKHGSGNGLTEITPTAQNADKIITKLSAFGGNRNLPKDYATYAEGPTLMLPGYKTTGEDFITSGKGVANYGERPDVFRDEEIYPSIHNVTGDDLRAAGIQTQAVGRVDEIVYMEPIADLTKATFNVWIKDIGFDVNDYKTGIPMALSMRDGWLGGNEFELIKCVGDTSKSVEVNGETWVSKYKLTLNRNDNSNIVLPDDKTYIRTGDHFVLLEIYMPDVYVKAAEQRLLTKAKEYLAEYDHVKATYSINMDKVFMAYHPTIGDTIYEGDLIRVVDEDLKLDREIIIQNLTIKTGGTVPEYEVTLSDDPAATTLDRVQDSIAEIERNATINRVSATKEARRKAIELQLLESNIFDPDGSVSELILRSMFLKIGADSMNYQMVNTKYLNGVPSNMNFTNTSIYLGKDDLIHFSYGSAQEQASTWHIEVPFSTNNLDPDKIYFVAVKASKDNLSAEWIISNSSYITEYFDGYYVFNFGILYNVIDGKRIFTETRGMIASYGSSVIAGRFTTMDGYSYWDMENGNFQMYNKKTGQGLQFKDGALTLGSFNPETGKFSSSISKIENDITETSQQAADAQKAADEAKRGVQESQEYIAGTILPNIESIQAQVDGQVNSWFYAYSPTLANYPASSWDTVAKKDAAIGDTFTNTQEFVDNISTPDAGKSWRWVKEGAIYKWTPIADSDAVKALAKAAKAEAAADGKSTIHLLKPSVYGIGDAWILESDTVKPPYKKGEMLNAVRENTVFNAADWEKRDLSADNAVGNLQIGGENLCSSLDGSGTDRYIQSVMNEYYVHMLLKPLTPDQLNAIRGNNLTLSFDYEKTADYNEGNGVCGFYCRVYYKDGTTTDISDRYSVTIAKELKGRIVKTWKIYDKEIDSISSIEHGWGLRLSTIGGNDEGRRGQAKIGRPAINIGNKSAGWTPSLADQQSKIDTKPNTFTRSVMPGSARKNDTWYNGETQEASLYTYVCVSTYTSGGTMSNWLLVADNTGTTIKNGLVTTGTIYLQGGASADKLQVRAGISGSGESDNSVRFWAGGTLVEANTLVNMASGTKATFAVTQNGKLFATNVDISGKIIATSGEFTGMIQSNSGGDRFILNPSDKSFKMIASNNTELTKLGFVTIDSYGGNIATFEIKNHISGALSGTGKSEMSAFGFYLYDNINNNIINSNPVAGISKNILRVPDLPRGNTDQLYDMSLSKGDVVIDTGQNSRGFCMLRIKL